MAPAAVAAASSPSSASPAPAPPPPPPPPSDATTGSAPRNQSPPSSSNHNHNHNHQSPPPPPTVLPLPTTAAAASSSSSSGMDSKNRAKLLHQGLIRFEDVFWGSSGDPTEGVRVLHEVVTRHIREAEDLIALVRVRVAIEETAASKFADMARLSGNPSSSSSSPLSSLSSSGFLSGATNSRALGLGKKTSFLSTGNGVTSVGSTPVSSGGLFSGFKEFANAIKSTTVEIASSTVETVREASANIMANSVSVARSTLSDSPTLPIAAPRDSNSLSANLSKVRGGAGQRALESDAANLSVVGANGRTDDASSLSPVIRTLREQMMAMAAIHRRHADALTLSVLSPLTGYVDQYRRAMGKRKAEVDAAARELARVSAEIEGLRHQYHSLTQIAMDEDEKNRAENEARLRPPPFGPVLFGSRSISAQELHDMVNVLKKEVKLNSILTPVGLFENCFLGDDAVIVIQSRFPNSPRPDIRALCQELVLRRLITPVVGGGDGRFSGTLPYSFGGRAMLRSGEPPAVKARKEAELAKMAYKEAVTNSEHARASLELVVSSYLTTAQEAESNRLLIANEVLEAFESIEMSAVTEIADMWAPRHPPEESKDINGETYSFQFLECPRPIFGVQHIATRYRTGHGRTPPFVFESFGGGRSPHQSFGISFDELAIASGSNVPLVVRRCMGVLIEQLISLPPQDADAPAAPSSVTSAVAVANLIGTDDSVDGAAADGSTAAAPQASDGAATAANVPATDAANATTRKTTWTVSPESAFAACDAWLLPNNDMTSVQFLRHEMNKLDGFSIKASKLRRYAPSVIAGVLRLFFVEAPFSLVSSELYDTLKLLYSEDPSNQDEEGRLASIAAMIKTLTPPNLETLRLFAGYFHQIFIRVDPNDDWSKRLLWSISSIVLRPRVETRATLSDEHPWKLTRDLFLHFPAILGDASDDGPFDLSAHMLNDGGSGPGLREDALGSAASGGGGGAGTSGVSVAGGGGVGADEEDVVLAESRKRASRVASLAELRMKAAAATAATTAAAAQQQQQQLAAGATTLPTGRLVSLEAGRRSGGGGDDDDDDDGESSDGEAYAAGLPRVSKEANLDEDAGARSGMFGGGGGGGSERPPKTTAAPSTGGGWFPWAAAAAGGGGAAKKYVEMQAAEPDDDGVGVGVGVGKRLPPPPPKEERSVLALADERTERSGGRSAAVTVEFEYNDDAVWKENA
ncbi:hypothetical protein DFJ73DRAFT_792599 [Zopfochytrium polystomum]|nr:hypothetical protein DFJ73DRAFT_792599 [Zopfochytrium polystomum]